MSLENELGATMNRLGTQALWRPLDMVEHLLRGKDPQNVAEPLARSLLAVDFQGKSVVDLGSNIGLYAFLAALLGAREVMALDFGPDIVRMGGLLAAKHSLPQVRFELSDFIRARPDRTWDLALMLDIIGHNKVRKGRVGALMDVLSRYSHKELVCNVRPVYTIEPELGVPPEALEGLYPREHLREGKFFLLEYLQARHGREWKISMLAGEAEAAGQDKPAFLFSRR